MNVWAVVNLWTKQVVAEVTHYQLAADVENDLTNRWLNEFEGPQQKTIALPFTCYRIEALHRIYI